MSISDIIRQHQDRLDACGLQAEVRFFRSPKIRAIYYKGHIALSTELTEDEAHEVLRSAIFIATSPVCMVYAVTAHLHILHDGSIAVWGPDSFSQSSKTKHRGGYMWKKSSERPRTYGSVNKNKNLMG